MNSNNIMPVTAFLAAGAISGGGQEHIGRADCVIASSKVRSPYASHRAYVDFDAHMFVARQLGRYHLLDRIACGGMAEIFRAKTFDPQGNEHMVAIKRVLPALATDEAFLQMLVDEAKIASLLDHPNIARVYEFARCQEDYFLAMEYVDGKDLRSLIDRCRADEELLSPVHCAHIMAGVADALHAAHQQSDAAGSPLNIVHRDVSPSNIIVGYDGCVKLCDFGIAKARLSRVETRAGVVKGKVRYMSPEQTRGWQLDGRSDVFSAGGVFYELLTQRPAFHGGNEMELVVKVRESKYVRPTRYVPDLPREVLRIIRKALARSVSARYQTAGEFSADLRAYAKSAAPDFQVAQLGRLLRRTFAAEIERDLRKLEEFVLEDPNPLALGDNLLDLPDGETPARQTGFTPVFRDDSTAEASGVRTRILPRMPSPESRLPLGVSLHDAETRIHDASDERRWIVRRHSDQQSKGKPEDPLEAERTAVAAPPEHDEGPTQPTEAVEGEPPRSPEEFTRPVDGPPDVPEGGIHSAPTKILRRSRED